MLASRFRSHRAAAGAQLQEAVSRFLPSAVAIETPGGTLMGAGGEGKALENSKGQFRRYWLTGKIRVWRECVSPLDVNRKSG